MRLPFAIAFAIYYIDFEIMDNYLKNYKVLWNGYDIACLVLLFILYGIAGSFTSLARLIKRPFIFLSWICLAYLCPFYVRIAHKRKNFISHDLIASYGIIFCAALALFLNVLTTRKDFNPLKGVYISLILFFL